jgi:HlyD family secretion protein
MSSGRSLLLLLGAGVLTVVFVARAPATLRLAAKPIPTLDDAEIADHRRHVATVASPGRVEPRSEEIRVGAEITGKVRALFVKEGQRVEKAAILVTLENAEYAARLASARAVVAQKQAALQRVVYGARDQERLEAVAATDEARVLLENKGAEWARRKDLFAGGAISQEEIERSEHEFLAADARHRAAVQRQALVTDAARPEDVSLARADLDFALNAVTEAESALAKSVIRSPIGGVVLRTHVRVGETVSASPELPLVTVADISSLRIRAEVDEADIGRVHPRQRAWVTAPAYGDRRFYGTLVSLAPILGRKKLTRDEPTERIDTKVLEVLVELEPTQQLPVGLRVDTFFEDQ